MFKRHFYLDQHGYWISFQIKPTQSNKGFFRPSMPNPMQPTLAETTFYHFALSSTEGVLSENES